MRHPDGEGAPHLSESTTPDDLAAVRVDARALIARAWQARHEALQEAPTDAATVGVVMARVEADLVRACELCRRAGASRELSVALGKLGHVALDQDHRDKALTLFEEAVAVARETGDTLRLAHAVRHLGQVNHCLGELESAERRYGEALDLYQQAGDAHPLDHANALRPMAALRQELGDADGARLMWRRASELYRTAGVEEGAHECEARLSEPGPGVAPFAVWRVGR